MNEKQKDEAKKSGMHVLHGLEDAAEVVAKRLSSGGTDVGTFVA